MAGFASVPNADQIRSLSLFIGQYKAPLFTVANGNAGLRINVRAGTSGAKNIYPLLVANGTGGAARDGSAAAPGTTTEGLTFTAPPVGTASVAQVGSGSTIAYNVGYTAPASAAGPADFNVSVRNPTGFATRTIAVNVLGVNSAASVTGFKGTNYPLASPLYQITTTDAAATGFTASGWAPSQPAGVLFDAPTGRIYGTPTGTGTFTVNVGATTTSADGNNGTISKSVTITLAGITSAASVNYTQGTAIGAYNITAFPNQSAPFAITTGVLPTGLNLVGGQISGTPTLSGTFPVTISANTTSGTVSQLLTINVASVPTVVSTSPAIPVSPAIAGTVNTAFPATTVTATNPPITGGSYLGVGLPPGLSVNPTTGAITGAPTASGDFPGVIFRATNGSGQGSSAAITMRINPVNAPTITSSPTVATNVNQAFGGYQVVATNPVISSYSVVAGALPTSMSLNPSSGLVSGTPTQSGVFNATFRATNVIGSGDLAVTFTINPTTVPTITSPTAVTLASGAAMAPIQVVATNPQITGYTLGVGSPLPAGLVLNPVTGILSGTPTTPGIVNTVLVANNAAGPGQLSVPFTIDGITSGNPAPVLQNTLFPTYQVTTTTAAIGANPYQLTGTLPTGLTFSTASGQINGTPSLSGSFPVTVQATTANGTFQKALTITITSAGAPVISTAPVLASGPPLTVIGTVNSLITPIQINASNLPINAGSYIATGLAATGLTLNSATGLITGTPTASGDFPLTLGASNVSGPGTLAVTVRINANAAPVFTSAAVATTVALGTTGAVYQITATNGPLTGYGLVAPSVLPAGLSLNPATGLISGTPTTSGLVTATLSATNSAGLTGSRAVSFTINPTTAPTITSPTFVSLGVGAPITPIQVVATNPPILSYGIQAGSSLPSGLTLNVVSGLISGTPTTPGPITSILTATNVAGTGQISVPFTIGAPAPTGCVMTVPLNTATTLDLKPCMFPAYTPAGVSIVATPAHGSVTVSGTSVTYTPVNNYFGGDSFSAVAYFPGNTTTTAGVVTVTITGRPDPAQDATVAAVVTAQAETAQRFSRAQISNFQRRMESLHQRGDTGGAGSTALQSRSGAPVESTMPPGGEQTNVQAAVGSAPVVLRATASSGFEAARDIGMAAVGQAPVAISQQQALDAVATGVGLKSLPFAETVTQLLTTNSINMANLVPSSRAPAPGATSFWVEGVVSFGNKDATGSSSAYDFSTSGVTFGADRRINDKLVLGLGLGYGRDKTNIGTDGSHNDGRGLSLAGYASYQPSPGAYIDGMLGIGSIDFDTRRYVVPINDFALGSRKGSQIFGSLTGGYEFRNNGVMFSPYLRLDYSAERLQDSTESGAGAYALTYFDQTSSSLQGTLGARGESIHSTSFGWAVPRVRAEFRHEFQSDRQGFISYADQIGGPRYGLATPGTGRDALVLGLGSDFIMRDGWTLGVDYQLTQTFGQASSFALQFKLSKDFDAKGLPKLAGGFSEEPSKPIDVQVDASYVFDDNVTRAKDGPDKMSDTSYSANVSKSEVFALSENARFVLNGSLGGERFQNFNGLSRISASVEGEYQYRESSDFDEPTFGLFGKVTLERYQSYLRNGYRTSFGVSVRQPLTDRISLFGALSTNQRFGNSAVFNTSETALRLNADYSLSSRSTLYATGEFRYGDIVSTGRPSLENISVAKVLVQDDAYTGGQFFSYKLEGRTLLTTLGYNYGLGPRDSLDFSWRRVESTPSLRPNFVTSPKSYVGNQWSVTYLVRF